MFGFRVLGWGLVEVLEIEALSIRFRVWGWLSQRSFTLRARRVKLFSRCVL